MWGAFLLGLSRARLTYLGLAGLVYLLYPRFATWRITEMWYSTFFLGSDLSTHIELDIGVEVYNPNYVGAFLHNATLHLYRVGHDALPAQHTIKTVGKPFGIARVGSADVPKRGHFPLMSHISIRDLPLPSALSLLYEMITERGTVKIRGIGTANVRAAKQDLIIWLDCLQYVNIAQWPANLEHSDCTYRFSNRLLSDFYQSTELYHPLLIELFASFDVVTVI